MSLGVGVAAGAQFVSVPGEGTNPLLHSALAWLGLFGHCAGPGGCLWVATEHLRDVGSSQGQEAAAEPKTMRKHYWPEIPNLVNTQLKTKV